LGPDEAYVSGDYSSATDLLSSIASKTVFDTIVKNIALDPTLEHRLRTGLLHSQLDYSQTLQMFEKQIPPSLFQHLQTLMPPVTEQKNGQLMGNILSFLVLCIVNISAWIYAMYVVPEDEDEPKPQSPLGRAVWQGLDRGWMSLSELDSFPVLINGDDILFRATVEQYARWRSIVGLFGLELSVGKNYFSPHFYTVNSELVQVDTNTRIREPFWGAFQPSFVRLRNELKHEVNQDVLSADYRKVLQPIQAMLKESVLPQQWNQVNKLWLGSLNMNEMCAAYTGLNWFLPVEQGGFGLEAPEGQEIKITHAQRALAHKMVLDPDRVPPLVPSSGSMLSETMDSELRSHKRSYDWDYVETDVVTVGERKYQISREQPVRLLLDIEDAGGVETVKLDVRARGHETLDSYVQRSLDRWLDYHTNGVRVSVQQLKLNVTKALKWGMNLRMSMIEQPLPPPRKRTRVLAEPTLL
jgi:hypothetical protein